LVINTQTRAGEQLVLAEKRWTTRHPLVKDSPAATERRANVA
jgi:flagellar assembly factor FliW